MPPVDPRRAIHPVRSLVPGILALAALAAGAADPPAPPPATAPLLVTAGDVQATSAIVWARAPAPGPLALRVEPDGGGAAVFEPAVTASPARDLTHRWSVAALRPDTRYRYTVTAGVETAAGAFRTAPADDVPGPLTLLWSADLGARGHCRTPGGWAIFDAMARRRPDLFVFAGDTIYADHRCASPPAVPGADFVARTLDDFRAKHRYNRADPSVQAFLRAAPVVATWDDHDVRNNFAGTDEDLMPAGRAAFLDYWPVTPAPGEPGRLHRRLRWGRLVELFVLDTRQYRSPNWWPDSFDKTMLGDAQRRWLVESVAASDAVWKIVVSSVPLSIPKAGPFADSWARRSMLGWTTGFAVERNQVLAALAARGVRDLVFLVGDVHFAALLAHERNGFVFHEFVAGPLAARRQRARQPGDDLATRVLYARGDVDSFGEIAVDERGLTVRLLDGEGQVLATHELVPAGARAATSRRAPGARPRVTRGSAAGEAPAGGSLGAGVRHGRAQRAVGLARLDPQEAHDHGHVGLEHAGEVGLARQALGILELVEADVRGAPRAHGDHVRAGGLAVGEEDRHRDAGVLVRRVQDEQRVDAGAVRRRAVAPPRQPALADRPPPAPDRAHANRCCTPGASESQARAAIRAGARAGR